MSWIDHPAIAEQKVTCSGCPTQVEGRLIDGRSFYFRYRYGMARLGLSAFVDPNDPCHPAGPVADAMRGDNPLVTAYGDPLDGVLFGDELNQVFGELMGIEATL